MIPKAKKNLHACKYHFEKLLNSNHFEELEINFGAFVVFAITITSILQKEFSKNEKFKKWYGDKDNPAEGTKRLEMKTDPLCKFFWNLRSEILKEGITHLKCNTQIKSLNTSKDMIDKPPNSTIVIANNGMYYKVNQGTTKEDCLPAKTKGIVSTNIWIEGAPEEHLNKKLEKNDLITLSKTYLTYLEAITEEWTGIINRPN